MNRAVAAGSVKVDTSIQSLGSTSLPVIIVISSTILGLSALAGYFLLRKRKEDQ